MPQLKKKRKFNLQGIIMVVDKLYHRSDPLDCVVWYFIFNLILSRAYIELCSAHPSSPRLVHHGYECHDILCLLSSHDKQKNALSTHSPLLRGRSRCKFYFWQSSQ